MVTFSCVKCNWTGKKKQVDKHYSRCGGDDFSCIDCGKVFGEDYAKHTSCIQEEDKYHGKWAKSVKKDKRNEALKNNGNDKKRKREEHESNGNGVECPPAKKQKTEVVKADAKSDVKASVPEKKKKDTKPAKKILKKILKGETDGISLKALEQKFRAKAGTEGGSDAFLQTLWRLGDKITIKL